jgi:hypothetical protein
VLASVINVSDRRASSIGSLVFGDQVEVTGIEIGETRRMNRIMVSKTITLSLKLHKILD